MQQRTMKTQYAMEKARMAPPSLPEDMGGGDGSLDRVRSSEDRV
jgi:hypothetical protein